MGDVSRNVISKTEYMTEYMMIIAESHINVLRMVLEEKVVLLPLNDEWVYSLIDLLNAWAKDKSEAQTKRDCNGD